MRVLVSGMTSRQANPAASDINKKEIAFAWLLAEACRSMGWDVEHRDPHVLEELDDFDHVFVGLAPLHGLGCNRAYGATAAILRTWGTGRLSLYTDDPDVAKIAGGIRTMATEPGRVMKPFFAYRKEYELASQPEYAEWLQAGVKMLHEQPWPRLIVPAHPWFQAYDVIAKKVPQAAHAITTFDLTAFLPQVPVEEPEEQVKQWVVEAHADDKWLRQQQPAIDVYRISSEKDGGRRKLPDTQLVNLYRNSWGVLQPPAAPAGWWNSRLGYARQALTPYVTKWQDVQSLGDAYTALPHTVAAMGWDGRAELAAAQAEALDRAIPSRELCLSYLNEILVPMHEPVEV